MLIGGWGEFIMEGSVAALFSVFFFFFFCVAFLFPRRCFVSVSECGGAIWQALHSLCF